MNAEFRHVLPLDRVESEPMAVSLTPNEAERAAITERLTLRAVDALQADIRVWFLPGRRTLALEGEITADVTQSCVVSLEPVREQLVDLFAEIQGAPLGEAEAMAVFPDHPDFDADAAADPEPLEGDEIDLGEIVIQYLSLALDPYPRADGQAPAEGLEGVEFNGPERADENAPFKKLGMLWGLKAK